MNKKYIFISLALSLGLIALANASSNLPNSIYPVKELGNCASESACKSYCDKSVNIEACLVFAKEYGLMSNDEIEKAQKFLDAGTGPGGCKTKDSCESYCNSVSHIDECVVFAEENNLMSPRDLEEAKKIKAARDRGVKMPACDNKAQCDTYCSEAAHMEECIAFAQEAGFMSGQELEESKKVLAAIRAGATPPPCSGKEECDAYCMEESHFDVCMNFAIAAGMMDPKDAEMAKKTKGKGPGGCRGKEQCDAFCQQEGNTEVCAQFAYDNGMMTKEEFEMMKKTKGRGPGGCKSKEECEGFCNNPANQETCFNFSKENGLMSQEEIQRIEQGKKQFQESMQNLPSEVRSCMESKIGAETMAKFTSGEAMPPQELGEQMKICFEQIPKMAPGGPGEGGSMPPGEGASGNFVPGNTPAGGGSGTAPMPGTSPMTCVGENCPPPSYGPGTAPGGAPGPMMPCGGANCPAPSGPGTMEPIEGMMPSEPIPSTGGSVPPTYQPPPSGGSAAPGSGGEMQPGVFIPPIEVAPSVEPQQQTAPASEPAPSTESAPPQSLNYNSQDLLGVILNPFIEFMIGN